jgi:hypothetical protein
MDEKRMAWAMADLIENSPALSRWHPTWRDRFATFMAGVGMVDGVRAFGLSQLVWRPKLKFYKVLWFDWATASAPAWYLTLRRDNRRRDRAAGGGGSFVGQAYLEALVLAILLGVAVRTAWVPKPRFIPGIAFSAKFLLECAVVMLGASVSVATVLALGPFLLVGIASVVAMALGVSFIICRVTLRRFAPPTGSWLRRGCHGGPPYGKIRLNTNGWERKTFSMAACAWGRADWPAILAHGAVGPTTSKIEGRSSDQRTHCPKVTRQHCLKVTQQM